MKCGIIQWRKNKAVCLPLAARFALHNTMPDYRSAGPTDHVKSGDVQAERPRKALHPWGPLPKHRHETGTRTHAARLGVLLAEPPLGAMQEWQRLPGRSWAGVVAADFKEGQASPSDQKSQHLWLKPWNKSLNKAYRVHSYELVHPSTCHAPVHM